jgi:integrase
MNLHQIKSAPPGSIIKDDEVAGLQLHVKGRRRTFFLYYRTKAGIRRRPKLGDFPGLMLPEARKAARLLLAKVALGGDPSLEWQNLRQRETMSELIDRYLEDYSRMRKRTAWREEQQFDTKVRPRWGGRVADEIRKEDILELRRAMRHIPVTFNRIRALLSHMFNFAGIDPNPCKGVPRFRENQRRRYLEKDEYLRLAESLSHFERTHPGPVAFLRLLLLTGCRSGELLLARREWYRNGVLTLEVHKTSERMGPKVIILPEAGQRLIESLPPKNGWLLGFKTRPTYVIDMIFERAQLEGFVVHDIRHSFASEALSAGYTLDQIGELLGHTDVNTTRRYAHLIMERKREVALDVAAQMQRKLAGEAQA